MKISKIFILLTAFIVLLEFASLSYFVLVPAVLADTMSDMKKAFNENKNLDVRTQLRVPFPQWENLGEVTFDKCVDSKEDNPTYCMRIPWIAKYIGNLYRYGVVIGSILAVMMIMIGGVIYMTGGANPAMITRGKEYIVGAVTGIILLLGSYILLNTINPNLINLQTVDVEVVKEQLQVPDDCDFIIANKDDKLKDKLTVPDYPSNEQTCGNGKQYAVQVIDKFKGEFKVDSETKCTGKRCNDAGKGCTNSLSGKYECVPAYIMGNITEKKTGIASVMGADGGSTSGSFPSRGSTAYVKWLHFREMESGDYRYTDKLGSGKEIGNSNFEDSDNSYMVLTGSNDAPTPNNHYFLHLEVNDISETITSDDQYLVNKKGNAVAVQMINGQKKCCTATCIGSKKFTVTKDENCETLYKGSELINNVPKLDLNTANYYCSDEPLRDSSIADNLVYRYPGTGGQRKGFDGTYCFNVYATKNAGNDCVDNSECRSGWCDTIDGDKICKCYSDNDCDAGKKCQGNQCW